MTAQRTDVYRTVRVYAVITQVGDLVDVDQHLWRGETELDHRDQALAPGQDLGFATAVGQERGSFLDRPGSLVAKSRGVDGCLLGLLQAWGSGSRKGSG